MFINMNIGGYKTKLHTRICIAVVFCSCKQQEAYKNIPFKYSQHISTDLVKYSTCIQSSLNVYHRHYFYHLLGIGNTQGLA